MVPYITFNGNAKEAIEFYIEVFGGEVTSSMTFGDLPEGEGEVADEFKELIMHAELKLNNCELYLADINPVMSPPFVAGNQVQAMTNIKEVEKASQIFEALAKTGEVKMLFAPTFWGAGYGLVVDQFGVTWHINVSS